MAQYVYTMNRVGKVVPPKREILKDISLSFFPGAKIGVLGLNGAGKSTLLRIMAGVDTEYNGEARPQPDIQIGYLPQEPELDPNKDVRGNVQDGLRELFDAMAELDQVYADYADPEADFDKLAKKQGRLEAIIEANDGHNIDNIMERAAEALRLAPWDADVTKLSGGERRRVALCRLLLSKPDMLLLDEPTNHLDAQSVGWLERFLEEYPGTVVAITHDRYFLDNCAEWILELDRGHGIPFEGNYTSWLEQKEARLGQEQKQQSALDRTIKHELELNSQETQKRNETSEIFIPPGERLGDLVVEFDGVSKSFGDQLLIDNFSAKIPAGAIVGVVGANGAGKSTLFRMVAGVEQPDSGEIRIGSSVKTAFVEQLRDQLDDNKTVWEAIGDGHEMLQIGNYETSSRAYCGRFNFKGNDQQKRVGELSGGERGRLQLACVLKQGANMLLLDEPSNDLDVETLRALEEALLNFPGCAIVISHDRWFLDRIATHILAYEGESQLYFMEGNYQDYMEDRKRRFGAEADQPKRIKYKRLN
jgi:sulfate-transporting ATPase